jgi:hypothetical protein
MTLRLNGSTSGYTEIDAPAVAGSNTLVLPTGAGSAYQVVRNGATAGSLEFTDKIVSGTAVASTSGTSIDFTGIPSWVKRVTVMFNGVSTNGTSHILIQIGTSGGVQTTSYASNSSYTGPASGGTSSTAGFVAFYDNSSRTYSGQIVLSLLNSGTGLWVESGNFAMVDISGYVAICAGAKTLSGTLDRVRITTVNGTDTFDAGSVNILYEG